MGWKIVEIEQGDHLNLYLNNIVIRKENDKIIIPINDIDTLLINNYKTQISINLINELMENNVVVIICDKNYLPTSNIVPIIGNYNTLKVLENQLKWDNTFKAKLWKEIIYLKITNQYNFLVNFNLDIKIAEQINILRNEIKDYDISNREGHASKLFWHALFGLSFKRHNNDYYNSLLNYGYTILRSYVTRSIIKKGLDPRIAIFHKSWHNYYALASDLMEPFRILIDYEVYKIYENSEVNFYEHKQSLIDCFNRKMIINGTKYFINKAIDVFIDAIVEHKQLPTIEIDYNEWL